MKHLGDITKINGAVIETVDCVCGGSPCQDLSVAGKRAGLAGKRSGLYMEQIRIITEMRKADELQGRTGIFIRPRYMVWENVPGAFSSNKGRDFGAVLEEAIRVAEPEAPDVPVPEKGWPNSGCLYDEMGRWSVAWRVHDAQFWGTTYYDDAGNPIWKGTPQRRKRIALVADFGGLSAPEILFERKGLSGNFEESGTARERASDPTKNRPASAVGNAEIPSGTVYCIQGNAIDRSDTAGCNGKGWTEDKCYTLNTIDRPAVYAGGAVCFSQNASGEVRETGERSNTIQTNSSASGRGCQMIYRPDFQRKIPPTLVMNDQGGMVMNITEDVVGTLRAQEHVHQPIVCAGFDWNMGAKAGNIGFQYEQSPTLNAGKQMAVLDARGNGDGKIAPTITGDHENRVTDYTALCVPEVAHTLRANPNCNFREDSETYIAVSWLSGTDVRRLTPMECERLQGYPDGWTNVGDWIDTKGKQHKEADTPRYKALGNSIALPFWFWLLRKISAQYERPATLGSLFDGIGGFPLCWERCNGKGTARWASEIEEFPIAVTKIRFPEPANTK